MSDAGSIRQVAHPFILGVDYYGRRCHSGRRRYAKHRNSLFIKMVTFPGLLLPIFWVQHKLIAKGTRYITALGLKNSGARMYLLEPFYSAHEPL